MKKLIILSAMATAMALPSAAQNTVDKPIGNPYLPLWEHVPDGEPRVFEDPDNPGKFRIYIIGSHDVRLNSYCGPDIHAWSAPVEDLSDWRDEGAIFSFQNPVNNKWDVMFAPDLVELEDKDGNKEYYLYPHPRGWRRIALAAKSNRPDGPFTIINAERDDAGIKAKDNAVLGFDPSVFIEKVADPKDPDYETGYKIYGYWGFQHSSAAQLDPQTMYSVKPGTQIIDPFIPASTAYGQIKDEGVSQYPAIAKGQDLKQFNFFEASSIRKVGNKYVMVYSGYSGPDYGKWSTNSALRYAFSDSPTGPWVGGGVLVDSRAIVLDENGNDLMTSYAAHNTHGSLQQINGQWYVFYHRPPRGNGWARQAMVAPVKIVADQKPVNKGGRVKITGYDPYSADNVWTAKARNGNHYQGAEVTSEGFYMYGLPPYNYYSAGYACYLSDNNMQNDSWDVWTNDMTVTFRSGDIAGYKYFGFGGMEADKNGIKAFEGTRKGDMAKISLFVKPQTEKPYKIKVMLDGPYANDTWNGKEIAVIEVPANAPKAVTEYVAEVPAVEGLDKKHGIYLIAEGEAGSPLFDLYGLGFGKKDQKCLRPELPELEIAINGIPVEIPAKPAGSNEENGYTSTNHYHINCKPENGMLPRVSAKSSCKDVRISIHQASSFRDQAIVTAEYKGMQKFFHIIMEGNDF